MPSYAHEITLHTGTYSVLSLTLVTRINTAVIGLYVKHRAQLLSTWPASYLELLPDGPGPPIDNVLEIIRAGFHLASSPLPGAYLKMLRPLAECLSDEATHAVTGWFD